MKRRRSAASIIKQASVIIGLSNKLNIFVKKTKENNALDTALASKESVSLNRLSRSLSNKYTKKFMP